MVGNCFFSIDLALQAMEIVFFTADVGDEYYACVGVLLKEIIKYLLNGERVMEFCFAEQEDRHVQ